MNKFSKKLRFKTRRLIREKGKSIVTFFIGVVLLFSLSMVVFPPLKDFIFGMFVVEKIKVEGVDYNDVSDLEKSLEIYKGRVNWSIDRKEMEHYIKKQFKWVKSLSISTFPSKTLVIYIEEEEPAVFYRDKSGQLWIVGENGEVLNKYRSRTFGYLYLPILECDRKLIPYAVSKIKSLRERTIGEKFFKDISEIIVKDKNSKWSLFLKNFKARVFVDPLGQFNNIDSFLRMKSRLIDDVGKIDYVDISFKNQIIVKQMD